MKYDYTKNDESSLFMVFVYENDKTYGKVFSDQIADFDDETLEIGYYNIPLVGGHTFTLGADGMSVEHLAGKVFEFNSDASYNIRLFKFDRSGKKTDEVKFDGLVLESSDNDGGIDIPLKRNSVKFKKA